MLRRNAAVVFQEPLLLNSSVYENVAIGLKFRRLKNKRNQKWCSERSGLFWNKPIGEKIGQNTLLEEKPKGFRLARAFAIKPQIILLDEAFNSLDPPSRENIIDDLKRILEETKITAVLASHDREETLPSGAGCKRYECW